MLRKTPPSPPQSSNKQSRHIINENQQYGNDVSIHKPISQFNRQYFQHTSTYLHSAADGDSDEIPPDRELYPRTPLPRTELRIDGASGSFWRELWGDFCGFMTLLYGLAESAAYLPRTCYVSFIVGLTLGSLLIVRTRQVDELENLKDASVLITGASVGVGERIAYLYAARGAKLFLTSRSEKHLRNVAAHCERLGASKVYYSVGNMANATNLEEVAKMAISKLNGRIDYLVLNHMWQRRAGFWHGTSQDLAELRLFNDLNFISYVHMASLIMPSLKAHRGRIVIVSSIVAKHPYPYFLLYSVSNAARDSFFTGLRQEFYIREDRVSVTMAILGAQAAPDYDRSISDLTSMFPHESWNETAECIIFGAYDRAREVYCPSWVIWPFSYMINVPLFRQTLEKIIAYYAERRY